MTVADMIRSKLFYRLVFLFMLIVLLPIGVVAYFVHDLITENHNDNIRRTLESGVSFINTTFTHNSDIASANSVRVRDDHRFYRELRPVLEKKSDGSGLMNFLRSNYNYDSFRIVDKSGKIEFFYSEKIKDDPRIPCLKDINAPVVSFRNNKFVVSVSLPVAVDEREYYIELSKEIDNYNIYEVGKSLGFDFTLLEEKDLVLNSIFTTVYDSYGKPVKGNGIEINLNSFNLGQVSDCNIASAKRKIYFFKPVNFIKNFLGAITLVEDVHYIRSAKIHFMILMGIFAGLLLLLGIFIKNQIVSPVEELLEGIGNVSKQIDTDQPIEPLDVHSIGEIGQLAEEYNKMASNLGRSFSRIKYLQNYLLNIFESMPSGLIAVDNQGKVTQWNRNAEKYTDPEESIYVGEEVWKAVKDLKLLKNDLLKYIGERNHVEISREPLQNGERRNINIHMFPLIANGVKGSVIRIDDLTELKKKEEQLIQAQKMETIGTLAGGIAHDFNNILSGIVGVVSILKYRTDRQIEIPPEQLAEYLDIMEKSGKRAGDIVQRLLTLSRKQNTLLENVRMSEVVSQVIKICSNTFDKRVRIAGINLESSSSIHADFTQLEQVVLNLAINANHAMTIMRSENENYGGNLTLEIIDDITDSEISKLIKADDTKRYTCISVKDTGVGMDSSVIKQMYEPFFSTKDKSLGTGLGLTIVYNIVQQFGGIIDIDSVPGKGTEFRLYFPKYESCGNSDAAESSAVIKKGAGNILVVDDEPVLRELATSMLTQAGYSITTASDGREAISVYKQKNKEIVLVLLDMIMPEIDGRETFKELLKINRHVKVIMTSGFARDSRVEEVLNEGAVDFIQKPYTIYNLTEKVYGAVYNENNKEASAGMDKN
ncbi:MAG: response regulator [Candidatus Delongbacteria bacterium]|nr:response regulator [Candidatus Delongbacteria bacterium]